MPHLSPTRLVVVAFVVGGIILVGWLAFAPRPSIREADPAVTSAAPLPAAASGAASSPAASAQQPSGGTPAVASVERAALAGLTVYDGPTRDRKRADQLREALAALYAGKLAAAGATDEPSAMPVPVGGGNQADKPLGRYVDRVMQEQFVPLAGSCYEELLARQPNLAGNVALEFSIMGDPSVGGVVVDVALGKGTTLNDGSFETCITESMYSVVFEAPPEGHPTVSVTQSFELAP